MLVPARVGGVDLSADISAAGGEEKGPRPCGRGGFKSEARRPTSGGNLSPPVWAGWI